MSGKLLGIYRNCDDALCKDCAHRRYVLNSGVSEGDPWDILVRSWKAAGGFESWDEPIAIYDDAEADTPTNCEECGELIPNALTPDGYTYVEQAAQSHIRDVSDGATPEWHSVSVVNAWLDEYADAGEMSGILVRLHQALYDAMSEAAYGDDEPYEHSRAKEDLRNADWIAERDR